MKTRSTKMMATTLGAFALLQGGASADGVDLLTAVVDPGTRVSPLVTGRMLCSDEATVTGTASVTIGRSTIGSAEVVAGDCTSDWNPIGFRISDALRKKIKAHAKDTHAVVITAHLQAKANVGTSQSVTVTAKLAGH